MKLPKSNLTVLISGLSFRGVEVKARRLIQFANYAHTKREHSIVEAISRELEYLPGVYSSIAQFYRGLSYIRAGQGNLDQAEYFLTNVIQDAPSFFRSRALQSLGYVTQLKGDYNNNFAYYNQALTIGKSDPHIIIGTNQNLATAYACINEPSKALAILEELYPLAHKFRNQEHRFYLNVLNSLAVMFAEVGKIDEAEEAIKIVTASPFAIPYPEYFDTQQEIAQKKEETEKVLVVVPEFQRVTKQKANPCTTVRKVSKVAFLVGIIPTHLRPQLRPAIHMGAETIHLIQSRVGICAPIHAPPSSIC